MLLSVFRFLGAGFCIIVGLLTLSTTVRRTPPMYFPLWLWRVGWTLEGLGALSLGGSLTLGNPATPTSLPPLGSALWAFSFMCMIAGGATLSFGQVRRATMGVPLIAPRSRRQSLPQREPPHDA